MNKSFGIDHPLIAVNDIETVRNRYEQMGFSMTAIGKHPWGTSTSLAMFEGCLIEVMGIYDDSLLDVNPAGNFHFGRHIHDFLAQREGVALSALHSTDIEADIKHAKASGLALSGTLEFGRDVTLPSGEQGKTKTTLALLPDEDFPRLSFFLCQQHRPELIYVPEWMGHQNTVYGYAGMSITAESSDHESLHQKFSAIYGESTELTEGFSVESPNGKIQVLGKAAIENEFGTLPQPVVDDKQPAIVALDLYCEQLDILEGFITKSGMPYSKPISHPYGHGRCLLLTDPTLTGNTYLRFIEKRQ